MMRTFSKGWPPSKDGPSTIRLAQWLRDEVRTAQIISDPAEIIQRSRSASLRGVSKSEVQDLWSSLEDNLVDIVYGSNWIESVGSGWNITVKLCRDVFEGEPIEIEPTTEDYQANIEALLRRGHKEVNEKVINQSRAEIVQHARAIFWVINRIVVEDLDSTEEIILRIHSILASGEEYAGKYRQDRIAVRYDNTKKSECIQPEAVPKYIQNLVSSLRDEIRKKKGQALDPYELAARYAHRFVCIRPFVDGNGRVKRIILNVLLLKYAGHVAPFGGRKGEREEHIKIANCFMKKTAKWMRVSGEVIVAWQSW